MCNIHTRSKRAKLEPRKEPYFYKISKGRALGYRRTETGGAWIARRVKRQRRLGGVTVTYHEALRRAMIWFESMDRGADRRCTIRQAIEEYTVHIHAEKGKKAARLYELIMCRHVPDKLLDVEIDRLRLGMLTAWLHELVVPVGHDRPPVKPVTANLFLNKLRSALNYAWRTGYVSGEKVWMRVQTYKGINNMRDLYMTPQQVKTMLCHAPDDFKKFCRVALLTGARPGEVANIKVQDFIQEHSTLRLSGKTGERTIHLSKEAGKLLRAYTVIRDPDDWLVKTKTGRKWTARSWGLAMTQTREAAELPNEAVAYSMRHYYISRALLAGVSVQVIEKNCGTSMEMISKHYGKFIDTDRVDMLNRVSLIPAKP